METLKGFLFSPDGAPIPTVLQAVLGVAVLALFWIWETVHPLFGQAERIRHATRNLALAVVNNVILGLLFGFLTAFIARWAEGESIGLLHLVDLGWPIRLGLGLVMLDGWMYLWHRANHGIPLLWRFHRVHHSDRNMDVTTATRFHIGEHFGASILRLVLIPVLGLDLWTLVIYHAMVLAVTQFHHADISLGRWDCWLRWLIVTPDMHKVHHSDEKCETDANFSTVLSLWDRLAATFRMRDDPHTIHFGLPEYTAPWWQTWWALWVAPFIEPTIQPPAKTVPAEPIRESARPVPAKQTQVCP